MSVRDDIPSKEIKASYTRVNTDGITIDLNFRKSMSLLLAAYKPSDIPKANWFHNITKALDFHCSKNKIETWCFQHMNTVLVSKI